MKKTLLKNYASLIVKSGVAIKKGDKVIVDAELDQPEFVEMIVSECYKAGAAEVRVEWNHSPLIKLHAKYKSLKTLCSTKDWEIEKMKQRVKDLPAFIVLTSEDPDGLNGINRGKYTKASQARYKVMKPFFDEMENKYKWCIAAVPGKKWAEKVFPGVRSSKAVEMLWEAILKVSRAYEGNPIENWKNHDKTFVSRCEYLNSLNIKELKYKASNGTDLKVGLIENSMFLGGGETSLGGEFFNANIPTEEIFITPKRGEAEGIVYSSKPFSFRGEIISDFSVRFENGKAVETHAKVGDSLLKQMIEMDEGAAYLGECAIVPFNSPINETGILFYNTLIDENACCHLALGEGFTNCIRGYENYTLEQLQQMGINDSMIHEDLMIGVPDLKITAVCADGHEEVIFDGVWKV